jgi:predicted nucleotidyltransferase
LASVRGTTPAQTWGAELGGLPERTVAEISTVLRRFPEIRWEKLYGSRALGRHRPGSDIDLAYSSPQDYTAALAGALEDLPMPYLVDVTHWESLQHAGLRRHIATVGVPLPGFPEIGPAAPLDGAAPGDPD